MPTDTPTPSPLQSCHPSLSPSLPLCGHRAIHRRRAFHCHCTFHHRRRRRRHIALEPSITVALLSWRPSSLPLHCHPAIYCCRCCAMHCCRAIHRRHCHCVAVSPSIAPLLSPSHHPSSSHHPLPSLSLHCHRTIHCRRCRCITSTPSIAVTIAPSIAAAPFIAVAAVALPLHRPCARVHCPPLPILSLDDCCLVHLPQVGGVWGHLILSFSPASCPLLSALPLPPPPLSRLPAGCHVDASASCPLQPLVHCHPPHHCLFLLFLSCLIHSIQRGGGGLPPPPPPYPPPRRQRPLRYP